ncbi:MAG: alpha/beta fold hydrolase [Planctomycetota bacterium]|jgi:pimeloyl-ACP methyl ester carboxylesterase
MRWKTFSIAGLVTLTSSCFATSHARATTTHSIETEDGVEIVFDVHGEGEVGLVFVHGWCCNRHHWHEQIDAFKDDYTLVMIDMPGHGESGKNREEWSFDLYAHDIKRVVDHLGFERVVLLGHSLGGQLVTLAAALMPDRVAVVVPVDSLQLVEFEPGDALTQEFLDGVEHDFERTIAGFVTGLLPADVEPEFRESIIADMQNNDPLFALDLAHRYNTLDHAQMLASCPVPVHAINAPLFPTDVETNRKYNADFHVSIVEDCGHWPQSERPGAFNDTLRDVLARWLD